uniref:Uncharacterized protein n=1 Tax=Anopheles atroparvus TaxID=41427 RepID=A0A182IYW6_ANOAO
MELTIATLIGRRSFVGQGETLASSPVGAPMLLLLLLSVLSTAGRLTGKANRKFSTQKGASLAHDVVKMIPAWTNVTECFPTSYQDAYRRWSTGPGTLQYVV